MCWLAGNSLSVSLAEVTLDLSAIRAILRPRSGVSKYFGTSRNSVLSLNWRCPIEHARWSHYVRFSHPVFFDKVCAMTKTISSLRQFLTSEDGPTAVEYAVLVGLIVVALVSVIVNLHSAVSGTFSTVSSALNGP
jgi:pilus assembly protein Flp/PilA